jgi:uncharacterized protein (TIGR00730 family)
VKVCVYCGSSSGAEPAYTQAATELGQWLGKNGCTLVYGGGNVGLMGTLATATLEAGGQVIGVITRYLADKELAHPHATEMLVVETMHERKAAMAQRADVFVALPGGFGTLEELFEALTWLQLGLHQKPIGLLNTKGFWTPLLHCLDHMVQEEFVSAQHRDLLLVADDVEDLMRQLDAWQKPSASGKWL